MIQIVSNVLELSQPMSRDISLICLF